MIEDTGFNKKSTRGPLWRCRLILASLVGSIGLVTTTASGQALTVRSLEGGTEVVLVTQTLAEMSAACWPAWSESTEWHGRCVTGSDLTFTAKLEAALGDLDEAPAVLIIVGGSGRREAIDRAAKALAGKDSGGTPPRPERELTEGGQERRLGQPGGPSILRLQVQLPSVDDPDRTAVEVLWNLLPRHLVEVHADVRSRLDGDIGSLEISVDGELGDLELRGLRLSLAQVAGAPSLESEAVEAEANRLRIARSAQLESVEKAGIDLLALWIRGGSDGIRQYLFGPDGVTLSRVREAAGQWLPRHPGHAIFVMPPRQFRPRFAPGPVTGRMSNDLSGAILARPSAQLATLVVRPVLLADLTGDAEAVVLTRLATALRRSENRPAYIAVETRPPRLELAAQAGDFPNLCEALQVALASVANDTTDLQNTSDARRTALRLMAGVLGMDSGVNVTPATVLSPGNLAIGGVASDAELALEALEKFGVGGGAVGVSPAGGIGGVRRHRMPAAGTQSAVAVALPLGAGFPVPETVAELITKRASRLIEGATAEVLLPLIPGRAVMVLVVTREGEVGAVEDDLRDAWKALFSPASEHELEELRKKVAERVVTVAGGVLGRARVCAAIAAGADSWRTPSDREMAALTVDLVAVNFDLQLLAETTEAEWTASGPAAVSLGEE